MPADPFPYGSHAEPVETRHSVVADNNMLGQDELGDVDPDWSPSKRPQPKVAAVISTAALSTVIIGVLALAGVEVPETLAVALAALLTSAAGYLRTE
jgi:hypothetical protein